LASLAESGTSTLTVSELVRLRRTGAVPQRTVVLTFDDGFADFLHHAMPALHASGMTATLYIPTGLLGGEFCGLPTLDWGALAVIRDAGFEIGGHSVLHPALDRLSPERALDEVRGCKHALEDRLGIAVDSFAYPFGFYTAQIRQTVIMAGYASACAVGYDFSANHDDPFALRRMIVTQNDKRVDRLSHTAFLYRLRSRGWRSVRHIARWGHG